MGIFLTFSTVKHYITKTFSVLITFNVHNPTRLMWTDPGVNGLPVFFPKYEGVLVSSKGSSYMMYMTFLDK